MQDLLLFLLLAVLLFWCVGAFNRLTRLRAVIEARFAALDEVLMRYLGWVQSLLPAELQAGGALAGADDAHWLRLRAALDQYFAALARARRTPREATAMDALVLAHNALAPAWDAVVHSKTLTRDEVALAQLKERRSRLLSQSVPLRDAFNDAVAAYNQAVGQFPALLLARLFGFRRAGNMLKLGLDA
ncbi:MAG: LemA family protein [Burkholderiaceae bacterium]|jgi:LemA protein|nr:LemA family protein [Burkholderiaceae bacterium]